MTRNTFFITNPHFGKKVTYWLTAFFKFVVLFDRPFLLVLLVLPDYICVRKYFRETFGKIRRPCELHIWGLNKSFPMRCKRNKRICRTYNSNILSRSLEICSRYVKVSQCIYQTASTYKVNYIFCRRCYVFLNFQNEVTVLLLTFWKMRYSLQGFFGKNPRGVGFFFHAFQMRLAKK